MVTAELDVSHTEDPGASVAAPTSVCSRQRGLARDATILTNILSMPTPALIDLYALDLSSLPRRLQKNARSR
jgi:hypothetical protein